MTFDEFKIEILNDYRIAYESRQASLLGRKEVLTGKAKFGIFGDGKEVAQIAAAKAFIKGDLRTGYYRDQTFMFATGMSDLKKFFAQLYANTDPKEEPASGGRMMNGHFGTRLLDADGNFKNLTEHKHSTSDISPTAGQMGRALGIAYASKLYRQNPALRTQAHQQFSDNGNEVSFCTIGNASTSEGHFWEVLNAAGVLQVPLAIAIWDDEYGISVHAKDQTTKENLSELLSGFVTNAKKGIQLYTCHGWDYAELCRTFEQGMQHTRTTHEPVVFHITQITQPQGHSTSGSHERYKNPERLAWETEHDCLTKMRQWIQNKDIATDNELKNLEHDATEYVKQCRDHAWQNYINTITNDQASLIQHIDALAQNNTAQIELESINNRLKTTKSPEKRDIMVAAHAALRTVRYQNTPTITHLKNWYNDIKTRFANEYNTHLHSHTALQVAEIKAVFTENSKLVNGYEILNQFFDNVLDKYPEFFAIGEDVGQIGDVNQGFMNLQKKYGALRVTDTGIREMSIMGQGIGAAMRGLRPLVEIQYLDYFLYAIQILSDDLATLRYRSANGQKAPLIVRTRGHRLEGTWHSGSPMGLIINALRGMYVAVPRNMVQAAGIYNTLLQADEPAIVIECLNGYRLKEKMPENLSTFTVPLGIPETLRTGTDATVITYGSCCRIAIDAAQTLQTMGISIEIIDVQTLLPFDRNHDIVKSIQKTGNFVVFDEDVEGGASAYIVQQIIEKQGAFRYLDAQPRTLTAHPHRPAYGSDGDYFSKPAAEHLIDLIIEIMHEQNPAAFPKII
jgi:pyruvate/2-oxoglutarate/acetoin dehydrogenase E1 component/TPP-dependent pyruvate/acetoin dehydrogenase alpha subunit